jgi:hypothetical protein
VLLVSADRRPREFVELQLLLRGNIAICGATNTLVEKRAVLYRMACEMSTKVHGVINPLKAK